MLIVLNPTKNIQGCGFSEEDLFPGYSLLDIYILENGGTDFAPHILSFQEHYEMDEKEALTQVEMNIQEWQDVSCFYTEPDDVAYLVYKSSIDEMELLRKAAKGKGNLPRSLKSNSFALGIQENECIGTIDYLIFAKRCEPFVVETDPWADEDPNDKARMQQLIKDGKKYMMKTDNHYVRLRYMYQLVRLAHYMNDYQGALDVLEWADPKVDEQESIINWWILGHKAGCIKRLGDQAEASYLFSKVFKNSPSKRERVYRSFAIDSDEEWKACLLKCESDEERSTLFTMRAMDKHGNILEEMKNIYKLSPASGDLTYLLVKEISRLEDTFLGAEFRRYDYGGKPDKIAKERLILLTEFVTQCLGEGKISDKPVWKVAEGYLHYLARDFYAADRSYKQAVPLVKNNEALSNQLGLFRLALKVHAYTRVNDTVEDEIYEMVQSNEYYKTHETFPDFVFDRLTQLYLKQGEEGKAFLCIYSYGDLTYNPDPVIINQLIALGEKERKTKLEEELLKAKLGEDYISALYELKGTYHLSRYELSDALRAYEKVKTTTMEATSFQPFLDPGFSNCVHCEIPEMDTLPKLTKTEITRRLIDLEYQAKTDLEQASNYYYLLGLATYNMSYFGHSHQVLDYYRSGSSWYYIEDLDEDGALDFWDAPYGNKEYVNLERPLFFFEKARELSPDDEFAARAAFMAAQCEIRMYYTKEDYNSATFYPKTYIPKLPKKYRNYYDLLINKYKGTDFYSAAIEECKYFGYYVEQGM